MDELVNPNENQVPVGKTDVNGPIRRRHHLLPHPVNQNLNHQEKGVVRKKFRKEKEVMKMTISERKLR